MGLFGKKNTNTDKTLREYCPMKIPELKVSENWIWVEGYKATNKDMQGYDNFQYELNKTYVAEGKVEICRNGFHFSKTLAGTLVYYYPYENSNRYFKVRALVNKESWNEGWLSNDKYVAKEIILIEEITYSKEMMTTLMKHSMVSRFVKNTENEEERIKNIKEILSSKLITLYTNFLIENISFIEVALAHYIVSELPFSNEIYNKLILYAKALEEGNYSEEYKFDKLENKIKELKTSISDIRRR